MWMSMRSSNGPEIFAHVALDHRLGAMALAERSLKNPQGHGFMAAASMKRAGKVNDIEARAMLDCSRLRGAAA